MDNINFVDVKKDLCKSCLHAFKGGCPIWPPLKITLHCVGYNKRGTSSNVSSKK